MNPIATALKHLIAAGVTGDALVTAIADIENSLIPQRSAGSIRQERYRNKRNETSPNVTSDVKEKAPLAPLDGFFPPDPLSSLNPPIPPKRKLKL